MGYSYSIEAATHAYEPPPFDKGLEMMFRVSWFPSRHGLRFSFSCLIDLPVFNSSECENTRTCFVSFHNSH